MFDAWTTLLFYNQRYIERSGLSRPPMVATSRVDVQRGVDHEDETPLHNAGLIRTQKLKQCKDQKTRRALAVLFTPPAWNSVVLSDVPYCARMGASSTSPWPQSSAHLARVNQLKSRRPSL